MEPVAHKQQEEPEEWDNPFQQVIIIMVMLEISVMAVPVFPADIAVRQEPEEPVGMAVDPALAIGIKTEDMLQEVEAALLTQIRSIVAK